MATAAPHVVSMESIKAAEGLKKAMKGMGTDEKALIDILCKTPAHDVANIVATYKGQFNKDLIEELGKEIRGDFLKLMVRICRGPLEADCHDLHETLGKSDPDKDVLIEILSGRPNHEIRMIKEFYQKHYHGDLAEVAKKQLSKDFEQFVLTILQATRDEAHVYTDVNFDVDALYKAGTGKFGTDETTFINILCNRSEDHLRKVFTAYEAKHKMSMEKVIKKEFSGCLQQALMTQVRLIQNRPNAIARQIEAAMSGIGTNEEKLARLITRYRDPQFMNVVEAEYQKEYQKSLVKRIEGETSGDFKKALVAMVERA